MVKDRAIKEKYFFNLFFNVPTAIKLDGGGLGLNGTAIIRDALFLRLPLAIGDFMINVPTATCALRDRQIVSNPLNECTLQVPII